MSEFQTDDKVVLIDPFHHHYEYVKGQRLTVRAGDGNGQYWLKGDTFPGTIQVFRIQIRHATEGTR